MKTVDAQNRTLGRVATEVAMALMGKDSASYKDNAIPDNVVNVINASKLKITEKKKLEKMYKKHTGYAGSLTYTPMKKIIERKGYEEVLRKAVRGMLPSNKLRAQMLKNLKITA